MLRKIIYILFFILAVLLLYNSFYWWLSLLSFLFIGVLSWGSFDVRLSFFTPIISKAPYPKHRTIALTFDDGPTNFTPQVLDLLKKHNAKATFFCIGTQLEKHPEIAQRIFEEGHCLGNHSYSHPTKMGFLSVEEVSSEIEGCEQVFFRQFNFKPDYYRPPFGVTNPKIAKALKRFDYKVIGWNNRSLDTVLKSEQAIFERVYKKVKSGDIVLMHDTSLKSVLALELLLNQLSVDNYRFVTIDELLNK